MNYHDWYVGMKVVCILSAETPGYNGPYPRLNEICTVSWIGADGDCILIDLEEYPSPETDEWFRGWEARAFRPVKKRKTDISIFTRMLTENNVKVTA